MRRFSSIAWVALVCHALAWAAFLWFIFSPYGYTGVKSIPGRPGEPPGPSTIIHANVVNVMGVSVIPILAIPIAITALVLALAIFSRSWRYTAGTLWFLAATLLVFCILSIFSIGLFYLPAGLVTLVTAILWNRQHSEATLI
jgi:hypothetical protein